MSPSQVLLRSIEPVPRHDDLTVFKVAAVHHLGFFMAALCNRAGHYIFVLWFLSFFPCLISVIADWMSTILIHTVWP